MMFGYNYCIFQTGACNLSHIEGWCQIIGPKNAGLGNLKGKSMWLNHPFKLRYNLDIQSGFGAGFYQIIAVKLKLPFLTKKWISQVSMVSISFRYVWNTSGFKTDRKPVVHSRNMQFSSGSWNWWYHNFSNRSYFTDKLIIAPQISKYQGLRAFRMITVTGSTTSFFKRFSSLPEWEDGYKDSSYGINSSDTCQFESHAG